MIALMARDHIAGSFRSRRFWASFSGAVVLAWLASCLAVAVQILLLFVLAGAWQGLLMVFVFSLWYATALTLIGAAATLPLTAFLALAVRAHWPVVVTLYGLCGWLVMFAFLVLETRSDLPALFAFLGVIPAGSYGFVLWHRAMRGRPAV